ncbi:MAG: ATP-binding cassette domain-containing protein [Chloroflexota bacterium]|nr:ATP-binding cassette domain-containing protein [Chloroflexota bacterium]
MVSDQLIAEFKNVSFSYVSSMPVLDDFSWQVNSSESWSIIGPSGCGKTTLIYLLTGLLFPSKGEIEIEGSPLKGPRETTGLVLQDRGLLPWATVSQNIALGLQIRNFSKEQIDQKIKLWLSKLGIEELGSRYPNQISGGQRQRVALARTLILDPDLLLMDEPFTGLDAITRESLYDVSLDLGITAGLSSIIITHDINEALRLSKNILVVSNSASNKPIIIKNPSGGLLEYPETKEFQNMKIRLTEAIKT